MSATGVIVWASIIRSGGGTALDFGIRATAASETSNNPPSADSPIWMPPVPVQVAFNQAHANAAKAIHDCALRWQENPLPNTDSCRITQFTTQFAAAYLHFTTNVALGATSLATSLGQQVFPFGTGLDGSIKLNQATFGRAGFSATISLSPFSSPQYLQRPTSPHFGKNSPSLPGIGTADVV